MGLKNYVTNNGIDQFNREYSWIHYSFDGYGGFFSRVVKLFLKIFKTRINVYCMGILSQVGAPNSWRISRNSAHSREAGTRGRCTLFLPLHSSPRKFTRKINTESRDLQLIRSWSLIQLEVRSFESKAIVARMKKIQIFLIEKVGTRICCLGKILLERVRATFVEWKHENFAPQCTVNFLSFFFSYFLLT